MNILIKSLSKLVIVVAFIATTQNISASALSCCTPARPTAPTVAVAVAAPRVAMAAAPVAPAPAPGQAYVVTVGHGQPDATAWAVAMESAMQRGRRETEQQQAQHREQARASAALARAVPRTLTYAIQSPDQRAAATTTAVTVHQPLETITERPRHLHLLPGAGATAMDLPLSRHRIHHSSIYRGSSSSSSSSAPSPLGLATLPRTSPLAGRLSGTFVS